MRCCSDTPYTRPGSARQPGCRTSLREGWVVSSDELALGASYDKLCERVRECVRVRAGWRVSGCLRPAIRGTCRTLATVPWAKLDFVRALQARCAEALSVGDIRLRVTGITQAVVSAVTSPRS